MYSFWAGVLKSDGLALRRQTGQYRILRLAHNAGKGAAIRKGMLEAKGEQPPKFWSNIMLGIPGETPEDAFKTMRMLKRMKRVFPSIAYYAPYPGSALGNQLIAEGKSLMSRENYHRYPGDEKVKGIDYQFYRELLAGKFDTEINRGLGEPGYGGSNYAGSLIKA